MNANRSGTFSEDFLLLLLLLSLFECLQPDSVAMYVTTRHVALLDMRKSAGIEDWLSARESIKVAITSFDYASSDEKLLCPTARLSRMRLTA